MKLALAACSQAGLALLQKIFGAGPPAAVVIITVETAFSQEEPQA